MTARALTCINTKHIINRPPALCRLIRQNPYKKKRASYGLFQFWKSPTGPP